MKISIPFFYFAEGASHDCICIALQQCMRQGSRPRQAARPEALSPIYSPADVTKQYIACGVMMACML